MTDENSFHYYHVKTLNLLKLKKGLAYPNMDLPVNEDRSFLDIIINDSIGFIKLSSLNPIPIFE